MPDVTPFNEWAKRLSPDTSAEDYDRYRLKYFNDVVTPRLGKNDNHLEAWKRFKSNTERPSTLTPQQRMVLPAAQAITGVAHAIYQPYASLSSRDKTAQGRLKALESIESKLLKAAKREGKSTLPTYAGEMLGSALPLAVTSMAGGEVAAVTGLKEGSLAAKALSSAVAFGAFESATEKEGHRTVAFVRGAAEGAAFEGAMGLAGKLIKRGAKPDEVDKIVTNILSGEKKGSPEVEEEITKEIEKDVKVSRAEGHPQFIKEDPSIKNVRVLLHNAEGKADTVTVRPGEEKAAVKEILNITRNGGVVDGILHSPNATEQLQRFMRVSADEGSEHFNNAKVIHTEQGHAKKIALEQELDGKQAVAVSPTEVVVREPARSNPMPADIDEVVTQLKDGEGYPLSKGAKTQIRNDLKLLWDKDADAALKSHAADRMRQWDLKDYIPREWQRDKIPEMEEPPLTHEDALDRAESYGVSPEELSRVEEIQGKEPERFGTQRWEAGLTSEEGGEGPAYKESVTIPDSESALYRHTDQGPQQIKIGVTPRRYSITMPKYMGYIMPGAEAATAGPGQFSYLTKVMGVLLPEAKRGEWASGDMPTMLMKQGAARSTVYHEGLHVDTWLTPGSKAVFLRGSMFENRISSEVWKTMEDIGKGLRKYGVYSKKSDALVNEEAFVHAATALRFGNVHDMNSLVRMDTDGEHVLQMIHDVARNLEDTALAHIDDANSRVLKRKMFDLELRSSKNRPWDVFIAAKDFNKAYWYDPESGTWKAKSIDTLTEEFYQDYKTVVDSIDKTSGNDWAPSGTLFAEARGVRGPFVPPRYHAVKEPVSVNTPPDTKYGGILSVSGWYRPMGPWVASLDQRVNAALDRYGKKLPIYARWKDVDDSVRKGEAWQHEFFDGFAEVLKGVDKKKYTAYFDTLVTEPRYWPKMAEQFGLDKADLAKLEDINNGLKKLNDDTNILIFNYLRRDYPTLRNNGYRLESVYGDYVKKPSQMSTFEKLIKTGKLDPKDRNIGSFIDAVVREGYRKKFVDKPIHELNKLVDMKAKNGKYVLGTMRYPLENYVKYMQGVPDNSTIIMRKTVGDFFNFLGDRAKEMNKHLPSYAKLPTQFEFPSKLINKALVWSYASALGLRVAIPIRDAIQVYTSTLPVLGPAKFLRGLKKTLSKGGFQFADDQGALLKNRTMGDVYGDIFRDIPIGSSTDKLTEIANKLMAPSRWGHNIGRAIAFNAEYDSALEAVKKFRAGEISKEEFINNSTSLWFNDKPVIDRILGQVQDNGFSDHDLAKNIANEMVDITLWPYRKGTQPSVLRTGAGRIFGQFGMWPLNYIDFLKRMARKYGENPQNSLRCTALWAACNYSAVAAMNGIGADAGKWFWFSPAGVDVSPNLKLVQDLAASAKDTPDGREARRRVLETPMNFIPAGLEMRNIYKAMESDADFFDPNGGLTPEALKVLGFSPHKDIPEKDLEEEILYQMGYTERRQH